MYDQKCDIFFPLPQVTGASKETKELIQPEREMKNDKSLFNSIQFILYPNFSMSNISLSLFSGNILREQ